MTDEQARKPSMPKLATLHVHALGVVGLVALAGAGYAFGYVPSARAQHRAELQRAAIGKASDEASATAEHLRHAEIQLGALRARLGPEPGSQTELAQAISIAAVERGLVAPRVSWGERGVVDGLERSRLLVEGSGPFSEVASLFAGIQASLPGVAIDGFSIAPDPSDESILAFHASLSAYAPQSAPSEATSSDAARAGASAVAPDR
jgi:Tfp pilus assembly protein PilO